jgi:CRP-like cAMP-binding protein
MNPALGSVTPLFDIDSFAVKFGGLTRSELKPGDRLYTQGESADGLFYIQRGQLQLTVLSAQGKEAIIDFLEAGDFCGEACLVGERLRVSTATCTSDCTMARLDREAVKRAIREDAQFAEFYLVYFLNRTVRLRDSLISMLFNTSERRLARILLQLVDYGKDGRVDSVMGKIDQEALAQMVGTTRSRINLFMNKFRKLGYIEYNGHINGCINVHSSLLNFVLHDKPLGVVGNPAVAPVPVTRN